MVHHYVNHTLTASQYKIGFVAILQEYYVPDLPNVIRQGESICSSWIFTACELSSLEGSDMLGDELLAMSLTLVGGDRQDQDISISGLRYYLRALNRLRAALGFKVALDPHHADISLVTCLACAMYEVRLSKREIGQPDVSLVDGQSFFHFRHATLEWCWCLAQTARSKGIEIRSESQDLL
jgi:hypothetical protein